MKYGRNYRRNTENTICRRWDLTWATNQSTRKTTKEIQIRINKAKRDWEIVKHRSLLDAQIKMRDKFDLWNSAIDSIMIYALSTLRPIEIMDSEIQQFKSIWANDVIYPRRNNNEEYHNSENEASMAKYCLRTAHPQLHMGKICDIYRWRASLSHAYLNNKQEMENGRILMEYNLYWMRKIMQRA